MARVSKEDIKELQVLSAEVQELVDALVEQYLGELNDYVEGIKKALWELQDDGEEIDDISLERAIMKLPMMMFFAVDGVENIGIEEDIAKGKRIEAYNTIYQDLEKGTIKDKTAIAESETLKEALVEDICKRAYKKVKEKMKIAETLHSSMKKVLTKRMTDREITNRDI